MGSRGDNGRVNPHTVKKGPVVRILWACGTIMGLPRAGLVPASLMLVSRKDRKQVGVGPGVIGDFNLVAKGYTVSLELGVDMVWSMRFETGRGKGEQRTGKEGFGNLTALIHFVSSSHGLVAALCTAGCAASEHQESVRKQGAARLLSGRTLVAGARGQCAHDYGCLPSKQRQISTSTSSLTLSHVIVRTREPRFALSLLHSSSSVALYLYQCAFASVPAEAVQLPHLSVASGWTVPN
jgi:hypothetical protein